MKKVIATIYWVYKERGQDIPYVRTLMTVIGGLMLTIFQIILIFNIPTNYIFLFDLPNEKAERWLNVSIVLTPLILLFLIFFRKDDLERFIISENIIGKYKKALPIYFILSIILLATLLVREGIIKGKF